MGRLKEAWDIQKEEFRRAWLEPGDAYLRQNEELRKEVVRLTQELAVEVFLRREWHDKALDKTRDVEELAVALRRVKGIQPRVLDWMRRADIVFRTSLDKPDGERTDAEMWEKVAFSLYTELCEVESIARGALKED